MKASSVKIGTVYDFLMAEEGPKLHGIAEEKDGENIVIKSTTDEARLSVPAALIQGESTEEWFAEAERAAEGHREAAQKLLDDPEVDNALAVAYYGDFLTELQLEQIARDAEPEPEAPTEEVEA